MGHWYDEQGNLRTHVQGSNGKLVEPDIRHARKMQLVPGITTIIKCAAAEALTQYRERQVLMAAMDFPREDHETDDGYCARVMRESRKHAENAALAGAHLHSEVEHGLNDPGNNNAWVQAVRAELLRAYGQQYWICEKSVVSVFGFATRSDLHAYGDQLIVLDIKTKDGPLDELKTYDEHAMQLAATQEAIANVWLDARCGILFVRRDEPEARLVEVPRDKVLRGWKMFVRLLAYWQAKNDYTPSWSVPLKLEHGDGLTINNEGEQA